MNSVTIRRCQPGDEALLSLVGQATFLDAFADVLPGRDILGHCTKQHSVEKYTAYLSDPASAIWVAEAEPGHAPVGYVVLTTPDLPLADLSPQDTEIKRIYILKRFQGGGLGARLMREAESLARTRGFRRLLLGVYSRNTAAIGFYEKLGYRQIGERPFKVGENTYHDFILGMPLAT